MKLPCWFTKRSVLSPWLAAVLRGLKWRLCPPISYLILSLGGGVLLHAKQVLVHWAMATHLSSRLLENAKSGWAAAWFPTLTSKWELELPYNIRWISLGMLQPLTSSSLSSAAWVALSLDVSLLWLEAVGGMQMVVAMAKSGFMYSYFPPSSYW